jgi:hypothetical protein
MRRKLKRIDMKNTPQKESRKELGKARNTLDEPYDAEEEVGAEEILEDEKNGILDHIAEALARYEYAYLHGDISADIYRARLEEVRYKLNEVVVLIDDAFNLVVKHKVLSHHYPSSEKSMLRGSKARH